VFFTVVADNECCLYVFYNADTTQRFETRHKRIRMMMLMIIIIIIILITTIVQAG